ncbi:cupin domain-containing protein [Shimazuella alba]|uniref:Cupin domain-containing protein n=1 Tax=Shimazuella alba TaxID=2690964 RepID=A0A6I4VRT6_9BACL|nr:cupin domain-containing protein [Shimazuella alba]MXQ52616.1 cupin domain-containing protein [Shimazuella alba]
MVEKVNLLEKFATIQEFFSQRLIGEVNNTQIKIAKLKGEFVWHSHEQEDELFFVVKGKLLIKLRDKDILLEEGEMVVIPKGVEHLPIAEEEVYLMLVEPNTTVNTGNVENEFTKRNIEKI